MQCYQKWDENIYYRTYSNLPYLSLEICQLIFFVTKLTLKAHDENQVIVRFAFQMTAPTHKHETSLVLGVKVSGKIINETFPK